MASCHVRNSSHDLPASRAPCSDRVERRGTLPRLRGHPLTDAGRAQAAQLVQAFARLPLAAIYASDFQRAVATAAPVAAAHGLTGADRSRGCARCIRASWKGSQAREIRPRYTDFFAAWEENPADVVVPGGESLRQMLTRASAAVREISWRTGGSGETHLLCRLPRADVAGDHRRGDRAGICAIRSDSARSTAPSASSCSPARTASPATPSSPASTTQHHLDGDD